MLRLESEHLLECVGKNNVATNIETTLNMLYVKIKILSFSVVLIRMFTNFGRDVVFSADLCYNRCNEKPPSEREVARAA